MESYRDTPLYCLKVRAEDKVLAGGLSFLWSITIPKEVYLFYLKITEL